MLDAPIRRRIDPALLRLVDPLARLGIGPNTVTVVDFLFGAAGCVAIAFGWHLTALALIVVNRIADGLDGTLARRTGATDAGGYLDIVLDTLFYSGVPFAFAIAQPEYALPAAFLIYSFVGTGGSFLAYAVIAGKRGLTSERHGKKSFYYAVGLMEGTETIFFFVLFCLLPHRFPLLAWTFGGLCWITTAARIASGVVAFRDSSERPS